MVETETSSGLTKPESNAITINYSLRKGCPMVTRILLLVIASSVVSLSAAVGFGFPSKAEVLSDNDAASFEGGGILVCGAIQRSCTSCVKPTSCHYWPVIGVCTLAVGGNSGCANATHGTCSLIGCGGCTCGPHTNSRCLGGCRPVCQTSTATSCLACDC